MAKTGKVIQLFQKPENFIRSRARQLPLGKCYISHNWEKSGVANVLVSRAHINGNFTIGIYLIDLKCLGIKDSAFKFNIPTDEFEDLVSYMNGEVIEYNMAHNIIYGAEAFAESCGFKPHPDWKVGQFILEEDDDRIPIIAIEFGENGVPAYYVGPHDDAVIINRILFTLDKQVGMGNYFFYNDKV
ncbi:hypothetical protein [Pedobacter sp. R20-19]|uniref:hypothetical protein n=1 Tax=Pedobacter sp. R20-19 TaxID=1270196 RepID=UPI00068BE0E9|nr:hypothetical protein [Pedobacter sp. R20-19]